MGMSEETLMKFLREGFPDGEIKLTDLAGDNNHWQAEIVSARFAGLPRVRQHQLVYDALQGHMGGVLHALALKTRAP